jgi:hypothetical protein
MRVPTEASVYSFRHARISELLQVYGVDPLTVAVDALPLQPVFQYHDVLVRYPQRIVELLYRCGAQRLQRDNQADRKKC